MKPKPALPAIPVAVSKHFRFDWQFVIALSRLPLLRPAATTISLAPIVLQVAGLTQLQLGNFLVLWVASVAFVLAFVVIKLRAPSLIQDYANYRQFDDWGHSHRWIVWLFNHFLRELAQWERIARETVAKKLSREIAEGDKLPFELPARTNKDAVEVAKPINESRDIHLPMWIDGKPYLLSMREQDAELAAKVKELFWILYTECAKCRPVSRFLAWFFFAIAVLCVGWTVLSNVEKAVSALLTMTGGASL